LKYRIPKPRLETFAPKVYYCRKATGKLELDGSLDKEFWADAPWTDDFVDIEGDIRPAPRYRTRVKMLWDEEALYVGAELTGDEIWAYVTKRDDVIFQDNDFEIFIDPDSDTQCYYEFEMNARNTVWDLLLTKAYRDSGKPMNAFDLKGLRSAVKIHGELNNPYANNVKWTCEVVLPYESLLECCGQGARTPMPGDFWRINFSRVHWKVDVVDGQYVKRINPDTGKPFPEDNWVWSPIGVINMHYPELWGYVFFCDGRENYSIPEDEKLKWQLRLLYYQQHAHYDETGRFTTDLVLSNNGWNPKIQVTDNWFEISCPSSDGKNRLIIFADGRTTSTANID
jgi:hypothetical protein